jgi:hypothetical protein
VNTSKTNVTNTGVTKEKTTDSPGDNKLNKETNEAKSIKNADDKTTSKQLKASDRGTTKGNAEPNKKQNHKRKSRKATRAAKIDPAIK